ncbi:MAG TPA: LysM peptidoglycan-binding domain-containing protein, partial [Ilumatobacteraceae bacterium]
MNRVRQAIVTGGCMTAALLAVAACGSSSKAATTLPSLPAVTGFITVPPAVTDVETTTTVFGGVPSASLPLGSPSTNTTTTTSASGTPDQTGAQSYTIVAKDTLFGIAKRYGLSAQTLADFNGWSDGTSHAIFPGDVIKLPASAKLVTTTTTAGK